MNRYRLASHVHSCMLGTDVILLDLKSDRYLGVNAADVTRAGIPLEDSAEPAQGRRTSLRRVPVCRTAPASRGSPASASARSCTSGNRAHRRLCRGTSTATPRDVARFLVAFAVVTAVLRLGSLQRAVDRVRKRALGPTRTAGIDLELASARVAVFQRLAPLLFVSRDRCLRDSLALSEFLAYDVLYPVLVLGVSTTGGAFGAHSWLQHGTTVFNDTPEHVRRYAPILIV